jgi:hypothetical protein
MHAANFKPTDWLQWFTSDCDPSQLDAERIVALDSRMAVVRPGTSGAGPAPEKVSAAIVLAEPARRTLTVDADVLRAACGRPEHPARKLCDDCRGTGRKPHACACILCEVDMEDCGCDGGRETVLPAFRKRELFGAVIDANLLAYLIEHAPASGVLTVDYFGYVFRIVSPDWTALIARVETHRQVKPLLKETANV